MVSGIKIFFMGVCFGVILFVAMADLTGRHPDHVAECVAKHRKIGVCKAIKRCNAQVPKSCYRMID